MILLPLRRSRSGNKLHVPPTVLQFIYLFLQLADDRPQKSFIVHQI